MLQNVVPLTFSVFPQYNRVKKSVKKLQMNNNVVVPLFTILSAIQCQRDSKLLVWLTRLIFWQAASNSSFICSLAGEPTKTSYMPLANTRLILSYHWARLKKLQCVISLIYFFRPEEGNHISEFSRSESSAWLVAQGSSCWSHSILTAGEAGVWPKGRRIDSLSEEWLCYYKRT